MKHFIFTIKEQRLLHFSKEAGGNTLKAGVDSITPQDAEKKDKDALSPEDKKRLSEKQDSAEDVFNVVSGVAKGLQITAATMAKTTLGVLSGPLKMIDVKKLKLPALARVSRDGGESETDNASDTTNEGSATTQETSTGSTEKADDAVKKGREALRKYPQLKNVFKAILDLISLILRGEKLSDKTDEKDKKEGKSKLTDNPVPDKPEERERERKTLQKSLTDKEKAKGKLDTDVKTADTKLNTLKGEKSALGNDATKEDLKKIDDQIDAADKNLKELQRKQGVLAAEITEIQDRLKQLKARDEAGEGGSTLTAEAKEALKDSIKKEMDEFLKKLPKELAEKVAVARADLEKCTPDIIQLDGKATAVLKLSPGTVLWDLFSAAGEQVDVKAITLKVLQNPAILTSLVEGYKKHQEQEENKKKIETEKNNLREQIRRAEKYVLRRKSMYTARVQSTKGDIAKINPYNPFTRGLLADLKKTLGQEEKALSQANQASTEIRSVKIDEGTPLTELAAQVQSIKGLIDDPDYQAINRDIDKSINTLNKAETGLEATVFVGGVAASFVVPVAGTAVFNGVLETSHAVQGYKTGKEAFKTAVFNTAIEAATFGVVRGVGSKLATRAAVKAANAATEAATQAANATTKEAAEAFAKEAVEAATKAGQ